MLPAHDTKHVPLLPVPFPTHTFHLAQSSSPESNGTSLWLCGQVLALYILAEFPAAPAPALAPVPAPSGGAGPPLVASGHGTPLRRKRAVELGSGVGLTALALASLGWDVLATDVPYITTGVLSENVLSNMSLSGPDWGEVHVRALDWREPLDMGEWELGPPFDLILSADTVYHPSLIGPLLDTLHSLASLSFLEAPEAPEGQRRKHSCPILLCLERRDPALVDAALEQAKSRFGGRRVGAGKLRRALGGGLGKDARGWEGVELWRFVLQREGWPERSELARLLLPSNAVADVTDAA
ncbi:hypothetical protein CALVIDRAFT_558936 [Calocera viscosa TUFC12733]|uniref:Uncharacterized protein n=1 Tax=Calocera viscosa (strain TUFC12733) TaxID=1330018 RepID=A0A167FWV3_CALVF|nr:hypothetical protein CALVIDRAFT_558936 [Calocera viscosa TUFC12733]